MHPLLHQLIERSADLAKSVQFDDNGAIIGGHMQGGNGGLVSRETIHKAGLVQRTLNDLKMLPPGGKEG
jgi:hypothetical protein